MTLIIKFGKRVPAKGNSRMYFFLLRKFKNFSIKQLTLWRNVEYALGLAVEKMKQTQKENPLLPLKFNKTKYVEDDGLNYQIEWLEVTIESTPEIEEENYNSALKIYDKIEKHEVLKKNGDSVEVDPNLTAGYNQNLQKSTYKNLLNKGYNVYKEAVPNKILNEVGILSNVVRLVPGSNTQQEIKN